eukprot:gene4240-4803_t
MTIEGDEHSAPRVSPDAVRQSPKAIPNTTSASTQDSKGQEKNGTTSHEMEQRKKSKESGLSLMSAMFFVTGDVVGAGIVALPYAMKLANYYGIPMFVIASITMCYAGFLLAKACNHIMGVEVDREEMRAPYATLAERTCGKFTRHVVTFTLNISLVLTCIVFLLLAGEIFSVLIELPWEAVSHRNKLRIWFTICGGVLLPLTLLGTPKDFWGVALLASLTSGVAVVMIIVNLVWVSKSNVQRPVPPKSDFKGIMGAFGTILFGFGGVTIFPTIQNDLKEPKDFHIAVLAGYSIVATIYIGIPVAAYFVLGDLIDADILTTFANLPTYSQSKLFKCFVIVAQGLICGHVLSAFILNINPVYQQIEGHFGIPTRFCWQRCVNRVMMMIIIIGVAVAVPNFAPVLSLVGGSFQGLLCVIFPIVFYSRLHDITCCHSVMFSLIIIVATVGSFGNAYVEIKNIADVVLDRYHS